MGQHPHERPAKTGRASRIGARRPAGCPRLSTAPVIRVRSRRHSTPRRRRRRRRKRSPRWSVVIARHLIALGVHALRIRYVISLLQAVLIAPGRARAHDCAGNRTRGCANTSARATTDRSSKPGAEQRSYHCRTHRIAVRCLRAPRDLLAGILRTDILVLLKHFERFVGRGHDRHGWANRLVDATTERHDKRHPDGCGSCSDSATLVQF